MSSQKGNVSRSRGQKHQNTFAYRNDRYGATETVKKAKSKIHDGLCQHCKGVLEWKVKYNKYKPISQPRTCVKCSQKTVKDAYHVICKPCSLQLEICCKCGKKEDIVVPINSEEPEKEQEDDVEQKKEKKVRGRGKKDVDDLDSDEDYDSDDLSDLGEDDGHSEPKKTQKKSDGLPDVSRVTFKD